MGKRGGAGAPELGISGVYLNSAYPRGVGGKRIEPLETLNLLTRCKRGSTPPDREEAEEK